MQSGFEWQKDISATTRTPLIVGYVAITIMAGTFGLWGATAPISGAAIAAGTVAAAGRNIQMQHLEGGIVRRINAREGDVVHKSDVVMELDDTAAKTQLNRLLKQWATLTARMQRLEAERDERTLYKANVQRGTMPLNFSLADILNEEQKEFEARFARFRSEQLILNQRLDQLNQTGNGLREREAAVEKQSSIIKEELARKQGLLERGLINRSDYTELLRIDAEILGQMAALSSEQATNDLQIAEAREQLERQKTQRVEDAVTKLNEARGSLRDLEEQVAAAVEVLQRTVIRAPADGIVVTSMYNVPGNVIGPGEKIMEIVPTTARPLVEARVLPTDVDVIHSGQHARLRFSALNARLTPEVDAVVQQVSADRLVDPLTQQPYYRALLRIADDLPTSIPANQLYPGMPVEAFISTGDRTFFEYLARPLLDSVHHAFVED